MNTTPSAFDFTAAMSRLCSDIALRVPEFEHIDMHRVAVAFAQARRRASWGLQARLTPMRFENGALVTRRSGTAWTVQRYFRHVGELPREPDAVRAVSGPHTVPLDAGQPERVEILYILTFYLPRFLDQTFREKMVTVFHELYHISPRFDGDLRRFDGRYHVHSHSQKEYDRRMEAFVEAYLAESPPAELYAFLQKRFRTLQRSHGRIVGLKLPVPRLIRLPRSKSA